MKHIYDVFFTSARDSNSCFHSKNSYSLNDCLAQIDLNFKHSISTQLNFGFLGLIESNGLENRTSLSEIFF